MSNYWKGYIICFCCLLTFTTKGQIREIPIGHAPKNETQQASSRSAVVKNTTLPFWDDFATSYRVPNPNLWVNAEAVFINNGYGYQPPTKNVATLDGFDGKGVAYSDEIDQVGWGDSLVSQPIDLSSYSSSDNIKLSFFWQEKGLGQSPDSDDALIVSFKNDSNEWIEVFVQYGNTLADPTAFVQEFLSITDPSYFHENFQFRFDVITNLAGDFDVWNIDYVYLNEGRLGVAENYYPDRALSQNPTSIFTPYYAIPKDHLLAYENRDAILKPSASLYYNLFNDLTAMDFTARLVDTSDYSNTIDTIYLEGIDTQPMEFLPLTSETPSATPLWDYLNNAEDSVYLSVQYILSGAGIDTLLSESIGGVLQYYPDYSFRVNDTIETVIPIHNFYAYDDGSAESAIQLNSKNYLLAQKFGILGSQYITAVDFYFPQLAQNSSTQNFTFLIWSELDNEESSILHAQNFLVNSDSSQNGYVRYELENPILVSDTVFMGYREENDEVISVGFDKNTNSASGLYYFQGDTWQQDETLTGSVMMRPVFDNTEQPVGNIPSRKQSPFTIYPNPSHGTLHIEGAYDQAFLISLAGQKTVLSPSQTTRTTIDLSGTKNGIYILQLYKDSAIFTHKIIVQH